MSQSFIDQATYIEYTDADHNQIQEMLSELEFINQIIDKIEHELNNNLNRPLKIFNKSSDKTLDYVTEADQRIEQIICQQINEQFPKDIIIGEETHAPENNCFSSEDKQSRKWFIEPIDGTMNFVRGIPEWCVSIACQDNNGLRLAAVADLAKGEIFTAARGQGAFLNDLPMNTVKPSWTFNETIYGGFIERGKTARTLARRQKIDSKLTCMNRSLGSAALTLAYTAAGRLDSTYFECPIYDWDVAAGLLLCAEVGCQGQLFSAAEDGQYPRLLVAGNPLFSDFKQLIQ